MEMRTPDKNNVELGDLLVIEVNNRSVLLPIISILDEGVVASGQYLRGLAKRPYNEAVILKKDGTYLIGSEVSGFFTFAEQMVSKEV